MSRKGTRAYGKTMHPIGGKRGIATQRESNLFASFDPRDNRRRRRWWRGELKKENEKEIEKRKKKGKENENIKRIL